MNERSRNFIVGLTTFLGIVGLMVLLLLFGYVPRFLQTGYYITLEFADASSLNPGSRVELSGIDIGSVEHIAFKQPFGSGVSVRARIREDIKIPAGVTATVDKPFLGGSPTIRFSVTQAAAANGDINFLETDGSATVDGSQDAMSGAFGELGNISASFQELSAEWRGVGEKVNAMLATQDLAQVEAGNTPGNLTTVMARLDRRLAEFKDVLAGADAIVNDPQTRDDIKATTGNLRQASGQVAEGLGELQTRYVALADDLSGAIGSLNRTLTNIEEGKGTAGKLATDPALYNGLYDASLRIGSAADELKLLIEKWKAEGVPVSF
jgi:phospholipid/cholesterol/gamma-HCH transport system substrate-binding protein